MAWQWKLHHRHFQTTWFHTRHSKEDKKATKEDKYPLSTPQVELLIQKMSDSYMSLRDMADVCDIKDLKYFRESYITPALEEGLIEWLYPNQPKHPKQ